MYKIQIRNDKQPHRFKAVLLFKRKVLIFAWWDWVKLAKGSRFNIERAIRSWQTQYGKMDVEDLT